MEGNVRVINKKCSLISTGLVYIFVQTNFEACEPRQGASADISHIKRCFINLGLTVEDYEDDTALDILKKLDEARRRSDINKYDCLVVVIISHFLHFGEILSKEKNIRENDVIGLFKENLCPGLKGKPKMFFFQVSKCQKRQITTSNQLCLDVGPCVPKITLPDEANILTFRSSYEAGPSHKPMDTGSWVIEKLCERLKNLDGNVSLLEAITTLLNDIKSNRSGEPSLDPYKTLPEMTSSLIQNVYFKNHETVCASILPSSYKKDKKMGRFYVFNYNYVWDPSHKVFTTRERTEKDTKYIKKLFISLGFEVVVNTDFTRDQLFDVLKTAPDFTDDTCVAVAVLTNIINGEIATIDNSQIKEQELYRELAKRPDLIGKPKIFVFDFCRRNKSSSYVWVKQHKENTTKCGFGMISDSNKRRSSALTNVCDDNFKKVVIFNRNSLKGYDVETKLITHKDMESSEISQTDEKSDSLVVDVDCSTTQDLKGITVIDDMKTSIDVYSTNTIADENSCTTTATGLDEVTTVCNKKISATVGDENDVAKTGDLKKKNIVNDTKIECTTELISSSGDPKNISPLEYDDILVLHSTYAESAALRDTMKGSWFIQEMCKLLEAKTENQEISLLDFAHEVHELVAKKDVIEMNGEYYKQMPVTISTLTQRLMLGPRNNLNS